MRPGKIRFTITRRDIATGDETRDQLTGTERDFYWWKRMTGYQVDHTLFNGPFVLVRVTR